MPARPMWRSPHKKENKWARGYLPEFGKFPHSHNNSGNVPLGKKKRQDRVKSQPIGWPQGRKTSSTHAVENPKSVGMKLCHCGGCFNKNGGWETIDRG